MRFGNRTLIGTALLAAALLHGEMQEWVQHLPSGDWLKVFFSGDARRPPAETRPALTQLIAANPKDAALYRLRAREAELQLDFTAAEADWRRYVQLSTDSGAAWLELADYFDRRHQSTAEVDALRISGRAGHEDAFVRALRVISEQALPESSAITIYRAWVERYSQEPAVRQRFIDFLISRNLNTAAQEQLAAYKKTFAADTVYPIKATADLAQNPLAVYEHEFQPLWPDELTTAYFKLLDEASELRAMLAKSRAQLEQNPDDFREAGRLFLYWRQQNNLVAARRVLEEYKLSKQSRKVAWKPDELYTVAQLFEKLPDAAEAADLYYNLYGLPGADGYYGEHALSALANLLLASPEQPIRFGSSDLSFYKDIATMDRSPGFFNGILSLILNLAGPRWEYARENTQSTAYFHRAAAAQLIDLLDRRFPQSSSRASLHAQLIQAYNIYGDDETVIRSGRAYLAAFPRGGARVDVALTVADALARRKREREEFALYDQMLAELGRGGATRSPAYVRVLDRYISRLAANHQPLDVIRLYRHEIDRNPNDPGLYERLAAFLSQANMNAETEAVYKQAIAKFNDRGWYERLARWYLKHEQSAEAGNLTRQVTGIFSGTELERYFAEIVTTENLSAVLYRQMNLYAHDRFPEDLVFVSNLLRAYSIEPTRDDAAAMSLLRRYWFYDAGLRNQFFETLARTGKLTDELAATHPDKPTTAQFVAEGEAWRSHFEEAAPALKTVAEAFPGDRTLTSRASSIYRSLATIHDQNGAERNTATAVEFARLESRADPRDRDVLAKIGDIYADYDRFAAARPSWDAMPFTAPGMVDAWRDAATVFWDYYLYDDALRVIHTARTRLDDPTLLAYEAGAIYEGKRQNDRAVAEYVAGYLSDCGQCESRILTLARRPALRNIVDRLTSDAASKPDAEWNAVSLRVEVLRQQQRVPEIGPLLDTKIAATRSPDLLRKIEDAAGTDLPEVHQQAIERQIAISPDPVEQARLRIELVRFFESRKDLAAASRTVQALYQERPQILGVVRAAVDYYARNQQPKDAIRILVASAGHANDEYRDQFTLEAARIATGDRSFDEARNLLQPLLQRDPYNSQYLAAMANTWLQAGDDARFRDFELAGIKAVRASPLAPADRIARIAALRRDLIPALTRLKDYTGAVDQYIEVIDSYPEDRELIQEAALYATRHSLGERLTGFYRKTIADAPRDYRWPMVLARVATGLEDFPGAISAYDLALKARPDRKDLLADRETLEERLMEFDRAVASCQSLYDLTYHDPQWIERSASLKARLGKRQEAIHDLRTALIGEARETPEALMAIAMQLDQWNYVSEAGDYAARAGSGPDAAQWARIMVRARKLDAVVAQAKLPEAAIAQAGQSIRDYYTPEEKAALVDKLKPLSSETKLALAQNAELTEFESDLLSAQLPKKESEWVTLETQRGRFDELAKTIEAFAMRNLNDPQTAFRGLAEAENAWRAAGDRAGELRVLGELENHRALTADFESRYFTLLEPDDRGRIVALARTSDPAVAFAVRSGDFAFARQAVQARGTAFPPVWTNVYTALAGIYTDVHTPEVEAAFRSSLGGGTIGERVRHHADLKLQITGSVWFYYGARYGEYLDRSQTPNAKDYLAASREAAPGDPQAYFHFAGYCAGRGRPQQAVEQYEYVLQLDGDRGDAENEIARILWDENQRAEAITRWRAALNAFYRVENRGVRVPETFWRDVTDTFAGIGQAKQIGVLQPDMEKLLRAYVNINDSYRSQELFMAALRASLDSGADYGWVLSMGPADGYYLLQSLSEESGLTPEQQEEIARQRVAVSLRSNEERLKSARLAYIQLLLDHGKGREAQQVWDGMTADDRRTGYAVYMEPKLAGFNGTLAQVLDRYRKEPNSAPGFYDLVQVAEYLRSKSHADAARMILEFVYQRELDSQRLVPANFLGLAGVYLESGQTERAVALLRRMNLVAGDEFDTFVPAATLLTGHAKTAEAIPFLRDRVKAVPWDNDARMQLARLLPLEQAQTALAELVHNTDAAYTLRATAAHLVWNPGAGTSTELDLLQHGKIDAADARKPFYAEALRAAGLYREALAMRPADPQIRLEAMRAALTAHEDSVAIAILPGLREEPFLASMGLSEHERAEIARDLAQSYERQGNLGRAIRFTRIAINLGLDLSDKKKQLEEEQQRAIENQGRAPAIRDNIEQDRVVRPRITGRAS